MVSRLAAAACMFLLLTAGCTGSGRIPLKDLKFGSPVPQVEPCEAEDVNVTGSIFERAPQDNHFASLAIENRSKTPCSIDAQPAVKLIGPDGKALSVAQFPKPTKGSLTLPLDTEATTELLWQNWCTDWPYGNYAKLKTRITVIVGSVAVDVDTPTNSTPNCILEGEPSKMSASSWAIPEPYTPGPETAD